MVLVPPSFLSIMPYSTILRPSIEDESELMDDALVHTILSVIVRKEFRDDFNSQNQAPSLAINGN